MPYVIGVLCQCIRCGNPDICFQKLLKKSDAYGCTFTDDTRKWGLDIKCSSYWQISWGDYRLKKGGSYCLIGHFIYFLVKLRNNSSPSMPTLAKQQWNFRHRILSPSCPKWVSPRPLHRGEGLQVYERIWWYSSETQYISRLIRGICSAAESRWVAGWYL